MNRSREQLLKTGLNILLKIKDSDIRIATLRQGYEAVDRGIHIGGAFSATVSLVALFYGGFMDLDIQDPTRPGQDIFVLSKGHAVATMASVYADLGYIDPSLLVNSRSVESILNGHPGPLLPGVQVATGPLAQGLAVAQGFALAGKHEPEFNVFCVTGDGELQEGVAWEAIMFAPQKRLDNLCMLVDKNEGQLDDSAQLIFSMANLPVQIESFGWRVFNIDGTSYSAVVDSLDAFVRLPRDGRPTAIVCNTKKGWGAFAFGLNKHKAVLSPEIYRQELSRQEARRKARVEEYRRFQGRLLAEGDGQIVETLKARAGAMNLAIEDAAKRVVSVPGKRRSGRVPQRDKRIAYDPGALPSYSPDSVVAANEVIRSCMAVFAQDPRVVSVDADLGTTSGLEGGVGAVDQQRGINVGVAESNMMCIGEAYAALGYNAWVSTFCPFFDWKVLRRIAVGAQERMESMQAADGWLSQGHGLDLTFLATAPNFETKVNGATHMGNDDIVVFSGIAGLKIIDVSCPNQLVSILRWIMEGNRGLCYVRIMRAASGVVYKPGAAFQYGKAYRLSGSDNSAVNLVSSGRGVHEILAAAKVLEEKGISAAVYDMPSFDRETILELLAQDALTVVAEQNNGFIWHEVGQLLLRDPVSLDRCLAVNARRADGSYLFVHSATYEQLLTRFGLSAQRLAETVMERLRTT
jgi:transketolase